MSEREIETEMRNGHARTASELVLTTFVCLPSSHSLCFEMHIIPQIHSMSWPEDGLESLRGKRVAVVGLAAAAVQIIPNCAKYAGHMTVYPRTPNWVHPRPNDPWSEEQKKKWEEDPVAYKLFIADQGSEFYRAWEDTMLRPGSEGAKKEQELCLKVST